MKSHRRYLTFSLRTVFILLTGSAVWLGVVVNRAREQREAVKAIEALGGLVFYDWEFVSLSRRRNIGDDLFHDVQLVIYGHSEHADILRLIPHAQRLHGLEMLVVSDTIPKSTLTQLRVALPKCDVGPL